ncbi:MAG: ABC transporter permease [Sciscionella sp.]
MTTTATAAPAGTPTPAAPGQNRFVLSMQTFGSVLWRDVFVTGREMLPFLAQVVIQPFFTLFIFGVVLPNGGYIDAAKFGPILLPGVIALNGFLGALQNTTMPLVLDFSWTREIEDRLLAPMPITLVAVEKMVFGALRGFIAAALMVPIGLLMLQGVSWPADKLLPLAGVVALAALAGAAIGMTIGTLVPPRRINIMFAVILTPLMFTGATQFPWHGLTQLQWFQVVCAINPLTYASEGMRDLLLHGQLQSIPLWIDVLALLASLVVFGTIGIKGFMRRALD